MGNVILRAAGISKSFAKNKVLDNVSIDIEAGRVHAVVGENGAGKSTLMKIIGGIYKPDEGTLTLDGQPVSFVDPMHAIRSGISIVHQELSLVPNLSVAQNVFSHREKANRLGFIRWSKLFQETRAIFDRIGVDIDPTMLVGDLSIGMQQIVEIAKALSLNAKVLILDEPTSSLSEKEVERLYSIVRDLKAKGVAIVFISHKLTEVFKISDTISVLRDGKLVNTVSTADTSRDELIKMMVGRDLGSLYPPRSSRIGEEFFSVKGLSRSPQFQNVSFSLCRGEILGFAGLVGSGRTEVARAIFGADRLDSGQIELEGHSLRITSPRDAIKHGICYLTEDRKALGLYLMMSVKDNIVAAALRTLATRMGVIKHHEVGKTSRHFVDHLKVRPADDRVRVLNLSGGNQQKVLLSQWLSARPRVLIVDEPTRGVDVGAKAEIHSHLRALAESGVGVIVISSELPEVLGISDRIAVFSEGRITATLDAGEATEEKIMKYATI